MQLTGKRVELYVFFLLTVLIVTGILQLKTYSIRFEL